MDKRITGGLVEDGVADTLECCDLALGFIQDASAALAHEGSGLRLDKNAVSGMNLLIGSIREAIGHASKLAAKDARPDLRAVDRG